MSLFKETISLLRKDFTLEFRLKYAISGIILYVLSTVFIVYTSFANVEMEAVSWNALFWVVILFAAVNAIGKSFILEKSERQLYYYIIANPIAVILSKMIYNIGLMLALSLLCWLGFSFVMDSPVQNLNIFLVGLLLGSIGFSIAFTFTSAIASKAQNSATLMAILSFPIIIPILLTLIKLSSSSLLTQEMMDRMGTAGNINIAFQQDVTLLLAIDGLLIGMCLLLFPFLWRN